MRWEKSAGSLLSRQPTALSCYPYCPVSSLPAIMPAAGQEAVKVHCSLRARSLACTLCDSCPVPSQKGSQPIASAWPAASCAVRCGQGQDDQ